jgi:hypothetical protein
MYVNLASSFTYISVLIQFTFIFPLQVNCASIYALPLKLLGLGTVAQLCLWLIYTRIILPTLLNKIKELTQVGTYTCAVCTTNTCQPIFQKQYVYAKHLNFVCIYTRIYVQEVPCQTLHHDSNGSTIYYSTTQTFTHKRFGLFPEFGSFLAWLVA